MPVDRSSFVVVDGAAADIGALWVWESIGPAIGLTPAAVGEARTCAAAGGLRSRQRLAKPGS